MSLRTRIAGAAGIAVAVTVIVGAVLSYVAIRSELRGEVDNSLRERAQAFAPFEPGSQPGPNMLGPGPGGFGTDRPPPGYRYFDKHAPAFGGAAGYVQFVFPDGSIFRPRQEIGDLPLTPAALALARTGNGSKFEDVHAEGTHVRVLTIGLGRLGAVQVARPETEVDNSLHKLLLIMFFISAGGIALAALIGGGVARTALAPIRRFTSGTERIAASRDVSRRIDVEGDDELARLARSFNSTLDELERSVDAQRNLVADAGHELRTPISSIRANIQLLEEADRLPESELEALRADIVQELDELTALVADIVELARGTKPADADIDDVRLDAVLEQAVERARRRFGTKVSFDLDLEPTLVRGQPERIARAVTNVLDNARKWSPPGGLIEVRLAGGELSVRDHGPGFAEEDIPNVFDRFFRSDRARSMPGSGLGLAIVRQAAEAGGGWVRAENAPGGGALVRASFGPRVEGEALTQSLTEGLQRG
jgi:two-component system sensor histidine kinase MprB